MIAKWEIGKLSKNNHPHGAPPGLVKEKPGVGNGGKKHPQGGPPGLTGDKPKPEEKILIEEQYQWDEENRLRKVTIEGRETDFLYNASGQRSVKRGQHGESIYADQFSQYFNKNTLTKHIFVGETRIVSRLCQVDYYDEEYESSNLYFYHADHLGSTSYVSNYAGEEFEHMEYTPYGESWIDEGSNKHLIGYRFTSKELDDETGLYYFGARYLDPKTSRWLSVDPAGPVLMDPKRQGYSIVEATNWYSYASNNPLKYTDPTGLSGSAEDTPEPWEYGYNAYRESVEGQTRPRSEKEAKEFFEGVERGIVGRSDTEFAELMQGWLQAEDQLTAKRGEIDSLLVALHHTINRSEGIKGEAAILLTLSTISGIGEFKSTGDARTLAETLYQAGEYRSEYVAEISAMNTIRGSITVKLGEYAALRETRDIVESTFIAEYKRRQFIRGN